VDEHARRGGMPGTDPSVVAAQAAAVAAAWSPPGAPASWALTAAQLQTLRDDDQLLAIAATIEPGRLPALLFSAAATYLVLELSPEPLRDWFPRLGEPQPPLDRRFAGAYRSFCLEHRERLIELCGRHRYQMNEVARCADLLAALAPAIAADRPLALIDIGTGAGLALHLDRYRYAFTGPGRHTTTIGDPDSGVVITTEVRGEQPVPLEPGLPRIAERVGIDIEPLELNDPAVRDWLAACVPQEIGAITRFHHAVEIARSRPVSLVRGDALAALPGVLAAIPDDLLVCLVDSYVHVFLDPDELDRFRAFVDELGGQRDLDWISVDPLMPIGVEATASVIGAPVPASLLDRNRAGAVFGVLARVSYRAGARTATLLGTAHPSAAWLEWLEP
jgi:hypothetical protein